VLRFLPFALLCASCVLPQPGFLFQSGVRTSLPELKGRVVVVNYWAEWCPACIQEFPALASMVEQAAPDAVLLPAYYTERPRSPRFFRWLDAQPAWFRERVCWADASVRANQEFNALPVTVVYGRDGSIVETFIGSVDHRASTFREALGRALQTSTPSPDAGTPVTPE
jgi:thiol-disulfide isomerase/thioredoxin